MRKCVAVCVVAGLAVLGGLAAAQEPAPRTGTVVGKVVSQKPTPNGKNVALEVLAPGEEKPRSYFVQHDPKVKGPLPSVLAAVRRAKAGDRVQFEWVQTGHGPAITAFHVLAKGAGEHGKGLDREGRQ